MVAEAAVEPAKDEDESKKWRSLPISDLEMDADSPILKALTEAKIDTLGQIANEFEKTFDEDGDFNRPILGLGREDSSKLADLINCAAEDDADHEEIVLGDEDEDGEDAGMIDPTTPEGRIEYDKATIKIIGETARRVSANESAYEAAKEDAAELKKIFEKSEVKLRELIREREENRNRKPQPTLLSKPKDGAVTESDPKSLTQEVLDELWQHYPVSADRWERWGLTAKDCEKLNSGETKNHGTHPILTLGDMTRFITPNPSNPAYARSIKDFKGFGDGGVDRWSEAETKFWDWWKNGGAEEFAAEKGIKPKAEQEVEKTTAGPEKGKADAAPNLEDVGKEVPSTDAERKPNGKAKRSRSK